ncbi:hypothetical protein [Cellulophaga tyrosinoxydans]|uniref:Uncharacterized protein n=1 Tax=Cellulophaga tyrosinoxydans TaxID=504486 RepID=A0A1W1YFY5_9FLAO|nr:hypothetical protein [Cellulophaga tyrosinoxydans]SMC34688.1 hypothetical protein SAMN05660703_0363 [Cellulophaga tyrosinoxydans]
MHKIIKIILIALSVLGLILWVMLAKEAEVTVGNGAMNFMFIITFILLAISVFASLFFGLKNVFATPEGLKRTLIGVGGLLLIAIISYVAASGTDVDLVAMNKKGLEATEGTVKMIGASLNMFFILTIVAIGAMVVPGIKKMFNK